MGTRSNICVKNSDGTYECVYCHWDGYYEYNGVVLFNRYNTEEAVRELLKWGYVSSLRETPEECTRVNDDPSWTVATEQDFVNQYSNTDIEYVYVFDVGTARWTAYEVKYDYSSSNPAEWKSWLVGPFDLESKLRELGIEFEE